MLKKCKYCNREFFGKTHYCSDICEVKDHTPKIIINKKEMIVPENIGLVEKATEETKKPGLINLENQQILSKESKQIL